MLTVGDKFPKFRVKACTGNEKENLTELTNESFGGKWVVYVFYPKDFTFVCPTELVEFGKKLKDFQQREATVVGGSTDNEYSHLAWRRAHEELRNLPYPLIAAQKLAADLGILHPEENVCLRATFIVDPQGTIRWVNVNDLSVGRSVPETLRVLDALQTDELCPCNWKPGDPTLKV
ncbi:MAG: peroxiredoxin [Gemmataceae bacterium]|nr:peroxiredoxin [Gemmataceae bacterium]MDW8264322.1 peroxiredoxin [Gemmataceae bacterium]